MIKPKVLIHKAWSGKTFIKPEDCLPPEIKSAYIDLSGLSEEEAIEKMKEIFEQHQGDVITIDANEALENALDEGYNFPSFIMNDGVPTLNKRSTQPKNLKKKTPAYVEQFGVNKKGKKWK